MPKYITCDSASHAFSSSSDVSLSEKLLSGVSKTATLVGETFGPRGNNIILSDQFEIGQGSPTVKVTKDGITVLRNIEFEDCYENLAATILRSASDQTNSQAGDGTTGTCILAESIFKNGLKYFASGVNRMQVRNGISKAAKRVVSDLRKLSKKISGEKEIWNVAYVSSNHSTEIADVLAGVFSKIGPNGTIRVEEGNSLNIESRIVEGMQFAEGYISPYFATNSKMEAVMENPWIFIYNKRISSINEILGPIQKVMDSVKSGERSILIIADDIDGDALSTIIYNRLRGLQICAVKSPSYGENRKNMMADIAILTGGKVISEETGIGAADVDFEVIGGAKQAIVTKNSCTIIGGEGDTGAIEMRVEQLKSQIEYSTDYYDLKKMQERLAKLTDGIGIVSVGANTELELKEKKYLVDDAFCACKAAIAEGVLPGGGIALHAVKKEIAEWIAEQTVSKSELKTDAEIIGANIVLEACDAPIRRILQNAGIAPDIILEKIDTLQEKHAIMYRDSEELPAGDDTISNDFTGYNVLTEEYVMMFEAGIMDSTSAIVAEVQNASSVAGVLLTTTGAVVNKHRPQPVAPQLGEQIGGF